MARTGITPTEVTKIMDYNDTAGTTPVSTTIDATLVTNGVKIAGNSDSRTLIRITNTFAGAKELTIRGKNQDTDEDVTISLDQDEVQIFTIENARFKDDGDGDYNNYLNFDFETGMTGTIEVYKIPK